MDLKLKNNALLSLGTTINNNIKNNCTTAFIQNCPNVLGINVLRQCSNLTRVRVDIGNVSGTLSEIQSYLNLNGFDDTGEEQTKPRIVGNFTITDFYTDGIIDELEDAIDGISVEADVNAVNIIDAVNNGSMAIQTIDSTKPNYNPAVGIILNGNGYGKSMIIPEKNNEKGYFITKSEVSSITSLPLTLFRGITDITDDEGIVTDDTTVSYEFDTFNEFRFFTGVTVLQAGTSSSNLGQFGNCTKLKYITLPPNITVVGQRAFQSDGALSGDLILSNTVTQINVLAFFGAGFDGTVSIPSSVTTIGNGAFGYMSRITDFKILTTIKIEKNYFYNNGTGTAMYPLGNGNGTLIIKGSYQPNGGNTGGPLLRFKNAYIYGSLDAQGTAYPGDYSGIQSLRVKGDLISLRNVATAGGLMKNVGSIFIEGTNIDVRYRLIMSTTSGTRYLHVCKNGVMSSTPTTCSVGSFSKIYVGNGSSKAADQAVFDLYNADTNWSTYCGSGVPGDGKIDLWWNYNGEYKWYYVTDNLTNCTNTNPDEWPHITRGESYETTIVPDEGMTIDSLTVEMLDTDTTSPTYDTYILQPTSYDSDTGVHTVLIPSVTGNVIITASAS